MKIGIKMIAALSMVFAAMLTTNVSVDQASAQVADCGCANECCDDGCSRKRIFPLKKGCRGCRNDDCVECTQCPSCEETCKLELDHGKVKKTCFKVEQKSICVPPVRFPWMKDCPPGISKTKLVKKLSTHSYECPKCSYKWTLQKCETPEAAPAPVAEPTPALQPQTSSVPAPPIFEVYRPNAKLPWRPASTNKTPPIIKGGQR